MRVLQIHNQYLEPGGEDGVVRRERALLEQRNHEVEALEYKNPDSLVGQSRELALANWNPASVSKAKSTLERFKPEVVHIHNLWYSASPSVAAAAHQHAPVVVTLHNYRRLCLNAYLFRDGQPCMDCVGVLPWRGVARRCYRDSASASVAIGLFNSVNRITRSLDRSIDKFLVLSDFAAELTERSGVDPELIQRHDNFVPDPGPRLAKASESDAVVAVGRLSPEKGFDLLIDAWNHHAPKGLRLVLVGEGPEFDRLNAIAGPTVDLVGRQTGEEVSLLMRSSRALVLPSQWFEGQPLVLLEALAAGLPILVSAQPPLREVVEGANQLVVEKGEWPSALGQLDDGSWLDEASRTSRQRFEERFSSHVAGARLEIIYEGLRG